MPVRRFSGRRSWAGCWWDSGSSLADGARAHRWSGRRRASLTRLPISPDWCSGVRCSDSASGGWSRSTTGAKWESGRCRSTSGCSRGLWRRGWWRWRWRRSRRRRCSASAAGRRFFASSAAAMNRSTSLFGQAPSRATGGAAPDFTGWNAQCVLAARSYQSATRGDRPLPRPPARPHPPQSTRQSPPPRPRATSHRRAASPDRLRAAPRAPAGSIPERSMQSLDRACRLRASHRRNSAAARRRLRRLHGIPGTSPPAPDAHASRNAPPTTAPTRGTMPAMQ